METRNIAVEIRRSIDETKDVIARMNDGLASLRDMTDINRIAIERSRALIRTIPPI